MTSQSRDREGGNSFERGCADANIDIQAGKLRFFWGTRGSWGGYCEDLFRTRFGVQVESTSCLVNQELLAYQDGYNSTMKDHIDRLFGPDSVDNAREEVQRWRKETYDAWASRRETGDS